MVAISRTMIRCLVAIVAANVVGALADETLYRVNSKDVGWSTIDLTISEVRRDGRISVLRIPHYGNRSAIESRFAMCAFTDIAIQRGFEMWIVSDGSITDDLVRVGFLKSGDEDATRLLAKDFVGDNALRGEVSTINRMCGIERRK
jgi:hypothetical protein